MFPCLELFARVGIESGSRDRRSRAGTGTWAHTCVTPVHPETVQRGQRLEMQQPSASRAPGTLHAFGIRTHLCPISRYERCGEESRYLPVPLTGRLLLVSIGD